jgi:hypothetical protein
MNRTILAVRPVAAAALILFATSPALAQTTTPDPATTDPATTPDTTTTPDTSVPTDTGAVDRTAADTVPDRAVDRPAEDRDMPWGLLGLLGLAGLMKRKEETRVVHNPNTRPDDTRR